MTQFQIDQSQLRRDLGVDISIKQFQIDQSQLRRDLSGDILNSGSNPTAAHQLPQYSHSGYDPTTAINICHSPKLNQVTLYSQAVGTIPRQLIDLTTAATIPNLIRQQWVWPHDSSPHGSCHNTVHRHMQTGSNIVLLPPAIQHASTEI